MRLLPALLLTLLAALAGAKKDKPEVKDTAFNDQLVGLFYFDDSNTVLVSEKDSRDTFRSTDGGATWKELEGPKKGEVTQVLMHPYDKKTVVVMGEMKHWISHDKGETFHEFESEFPPSGSSPAIIFHGTDSDRMILMTEDCSLFFTCTSMAYYTTDSFKSKPKPLKENAQSCLWAKSTDLFTTGDDKLDHDQILCIVRGRSIFSNDNELRITSDFFEQEDERPAMNDGSPVRGISNLASVKNYIVAAARSPRSSELAMYVTSDLKSWNRAQFGDHRVEEDGYTLLESTNYSMQVDVQTTKFSNPMGTLLTSNVEGTFFRKNIEHTNRNLQGFVDFEKVQDIQGIVLVNIVDNWKEVEKQRNTKKKIKTRISFDDGTPESWHELKVDGKELHLHSVTDMRNLGRVLSSPAPGLCMGVGNTGDHLEGYDDGDTYVSDDAGLTWTRALKGPHLYEFGDKGGVIIAIEDKEKTDKMKYSIDHGKNWDDFKLKDDVAPIALTTTPDSTSLKFLLMAVKGKGTNAKPYIYMIDFDDMHERECKSSDFEDWWARVDDKGEPTCIMGHKQKFRRRKADAKCFVNEEFKDAEMHTENCHCEEHDYECDIENGFSWNSDKKECELKGKLSPPEGKCENDDDTFEGPSGYLLKPGNTCEGGKKYEPVERKCGETKKTPIASGNIGIERTEFEHGEIFNEFYYLERADTHEGDEETVVARVGDKAYITHDQGLHWDPIKDPIKDADKVQGIYVHEFKDDTFYLVTEGKRVYYSRNYGHNYDHFDAPRPPVNNAYVKALQFHTKQNLDWMIFTGEEDGRTVASVSTNGGDDWRTFGLHHIRKCQFVYREDRNNTDKLVLCEFHEDGDPNGPLTLMSSEDWFESRDTLQKDVINFATMAEYIVVAYRDPGETSSLKLRISIDGSTFADAKFPPNYKADPGHASAYTVMDSSSHAVFLHVTVKEDRGKEYGSIVKSNSNGTSYVLSVGEVNRDDEGYVDFEKMQGLEGVALVNRISNVKDVEGGSDKELKTWMTHNEGAEWDLIKPPTVKPGEGPGWSCSGDVSQCSLHFHGYTEKEDGRQTSSSRSAVNLIIATGNVGDKLVRKGADETYTFVSNDGGVSWTTVAHGSWRWAIGDSGSIIVLVKEGGPTKTLKYSLDEGKTWLEKEFSEDEVDVQALSTVPSDTSRAFILWTKHKGTLATIRVDFSELKERSKQCKLDEKAPEADDFLLWSPSHPSAQEENCLFGHVAQYHRKKPDSECYVGRKFELEEMHGIAKNCSCTRSDFECDYNYERQSDGSCKLVPGLNPPDAMDVCRKDPNRIEYYDITGYRKIPISTCSGGRDLEYTAASKPCPDHEDEYEAKHGISGIGLFFAIVIPIGAAAGVGYWVYQNWDGKFGRIRLGGDGSSFSAAGSHAFDREAPWIKYPIMALSGIVAVIAALPLVIGSVWHAVNTRLGRSRGGYGTAPYTSRASFARGRGDYAAVDADEGELLGDDSDEDV